LSKPVESERDIPLIYSERDITSINEVFLKSGPEPNAGATIKTVQNTFTMLGNMN
jgi:hypothetical protein